MSDSDAQLDELEATLARAETSLEALEADLGRGPPPLQPSPWVRRSCGGCGATELLIARAVLDRAEAWARTAMSLQQPSWWSFEGAGKLQALVCRRCGLTSWRVADLDGVKVDGKTTLLIGGGGGGDANG